MKQPCVYIVANKRNGTLYIGVTASLPRAGLRTPPRFIEGIFRQYGCKMLVWFELHESMIEAIAREKQIKAGSRAKKLALIEALNPKWNDLYDTLV